MSPPVVVGAAFKIDHERDLSERVSARRCDVIIDRGVQGQYRKWSVSTVRASDYSRVVHCDSAVFCALQYQLASL